MHYITDIREVNIPKLTTLMAASVQAYNAFSSDHPTHCEKDNIVAPSGFEFLTCWSGVDSVFHHDATEEVFGLVFRSIKAPYTYIFAFRGTASLLDAIDDIGVEHQGFKPHDSRIPVSSDVKVESGFNEIYTESTSSVKSMQTQVFELIDGYQNSNKPIKDLWITGHSLGSSLATLFSLDVGLSRPKIRATNMNFACPRTGNQAFVDLVEQTLALKNILRVQNTYDKVPCAPFVGMDYSHTPWVLLLAFYENGLEELNLVARHSALNYQAVLNCAKGSHNGVCIENDLMVKHPDGNKTTTQHLTSKPADTKTVCDLF